MNNPMQEVNRFYCTCNLMYNVQSVYCYRYTYMYVCMYHSARSINLDKTFV